jgi:hypothetical protein
VVLVSPETTGEVAAAMMTRLRGELRAASFEMDVVTISTEAPRRGTVEEAANQSGAIAALGIFFGAGRVEMWAADASAGRTLMQNLPLDSGASDRRATVVAVKAVDLLKALLADIWNDPTATLPAPAPAPAPLAAATPAPTPEVTEVNISATETPAATPVAPDRFSITAGAGWLNEGEISGWAPLVALSAAIGAGRLGVRFTLSALGPSVGVSAAAGSAQLAQQIGLLELLVWSREWHRLRGLLALGAGAHHLSIDSRGAAGFTGVNHDLWSATASAGGGVTLGVLHWLVVALDARAAENWPATTVQIDGTRTARIGRPILWLALGAGVRFP